MTAARDGIGVPGAAGAPDATGAPDGWAAIGGAAPRSVTVDGVEIGRGSRVRLRPRDTGGDVFDRALQGRVAVVERLLESVEGQVQVAVTVADDPGRDIGEDRRPGHRFFFSVEEVEPLEGEHQAPPGTRVLVAGIGNVFLGDDGFGCELARRLAQRELPRGVEVKDFGIRGMDLLYTLNEHFDVAIFLDATPRGGAPGTVYVIEPEIDEGDVALDAHGMDPVKVLALARQLGPVPERMFVVGCEPETVMSPDAEEVVAELSEPVRAALDGAVETVESLIEELLSEEESERSVSPT